MVHRAIILEFHHYTSYIMNELHLLLTSCVITKHG